MNSVLHLQTEKHIQKIIAKRIAVLFTFSIANKSIAIAFVSISNNFVLLEASWKFWDFEELSRRGGVNCKCSRFTTPALSANAVLQWSSQRCNTAVHSQSVTYFVKHRWTTPRRRIWSYTTRNQQKFVTLWLQALPVILLIYITEHRLCMSCIHSYGCITVIPGSSVLGGLNILIARRCLLSVCVSRSSTTKSRKRFNVIAHVSVWLMCHFGVKRSKIRLSQQWACGGWMKINIGDTAVTSLRYLLLLLLLRLSSMIAWRMTSLHRQQQCKLECGPMPNLMVALPNIGGALCSTPQSLADAHY